MQQLDLKKATVYILHGDLAMRTEIRLLLSEQNARAVEFGKVGDMVNTIKMEMPAAILACVDAPTSGVISMMTKIRVGEVGNNPFVPSIAITGDDSDDQWKRVINAGFNLILHSPFSRQNIWNVVKRLYEDNRNFIVTKEYIGPQRVVQNKPEPLLPHVTPIEIPNTLEGAATGAPVKAATIKAAFNKVVEERVKNAAYMTLAKFEQSIQQAVDDPRSAFAEMVTLCAAALEDIEMSSIANAKPTFELCQSYAGVISEHGFDSQDRALSLELIDALSRTVLGNHLDEGTWADLHTRITARMVEKSS